MTQNTLLAQRQVLNLDLRVNPDKTPYMTIDFANVSGFELAEGNVVYATGGYDAPRLVSFSSPGDATLKLETQAYTPQLLALIMGSKLGNSGVVSVKETLEVASGAATLGQTPISGTAVLYALNDDYGTPVACTVAGQAVTITDAGVADGDKLIARYLFTKTTGVMSIEVNVGTPMPELYAIGETIYKSTDGVNHYAHIEFFRLALRQAFNFSFSNSGDPSNITLTFDVLANDERQLGRILIED
jgi:hypothetical protein